MPPPPIHRWKSFWVGILILLFLTGSWLRSIHYAETVTFGDPYRSAFISSGQSGGMYIITFSQRPEPAYLVCYHPFIGHAGDTVVAWRDPHGRPHYDLPPPASGMWQSTWCRIGISQWLLILLFILSWTLFHQRRQRLIHEMAHPLIPEPAP